MHLTEPYIKAKDEPKQTGLFDLFAAKYGRPGTVIKHNMFTPDEPVVNEQEAEAPEIPEMTNENFGTGG